MAKDFIKVDRTRNTALMASLIVEYAQTLRRAYELGVKCKAIMDHNNDGEDWTDIEALFGLPVGKGQIVYDLVNGSIGSMTGVFQNANAKDLTEVLG